MRSKWGTVPSSTMSSDASSALSPLVLLAAPCGPLAASRLTIHVRRRSRRTSWHLIRGLPRAHARSATERQMRRRRRGVVMRAWRCTRSREAHKLTEHTHTHIPHWFCAVLICTPARHPLTQHLPATGCGALLLRASCCGAGAPCCLRGELGRRRGFRLRAERRGQAALPYGVSVQRERW